MKKVVINPEGEVVLAYDDMIGEGIRIVIGDNNTHLNVGEVTEVAWRDLKRNARSFKHEGGKLKKVDKRNQKAVE